MNLHKATILTLLSSKVGWQIVVTGWQMLGRFRLADRQITMVGTADQQTSRLADGCCGVGVGDEFQS